eukprot:UN15711
MFIILHTVDHNVMIFIAEGIDSSQCCDLNMGLCECRIYLIPIGTLE